LKDSATAQLHLEIAGTEHRKKMKNANHLPQMKARRRGPRGLKRNLEEGVGRLDDTSLVPWGGERNQEKAKVSDEWGPRRKDSTVRPIM